MLNFYVYILRCADGSYYVGHTDNLEARLAGHMSGVPVCYTSTRLPVKLAYAQEFATRDEAFNVERQIKGWSRKKKEALISGDWDRLVALSNSHKTRNPSTSSGRAE